jgi:hypothetical protein
VLEIAVDCLIGAGRGSSGSRCYRKGIQHRVGVGVAESDTPSTNSAESSLPQGAS